MSFFNFSLPAFLLVPSTEKYERRWRRLSRLHTRYHEIQESDYFHRYGELHAYVSSPEYHEELAQIRSMKWNESKEQLMAQRFKELKKYQEVKRFLKKGETGSEYVKEYLELQDYVQSPSFKKHKAFLKNRKRHLQSDSYQKFLEYKRLAKSHEVREHIQLHKKYNELFVEMEKMQTLLDDEFRTAQMAPHWSTSLLQSQHTFKQLYSQNEELQCTTVGTNIEQQNGVFRIYTRKENASAMAWDERFGFVPRKYHYTSGLISTVENFQLCRTGTIEIKLRFPNVKNVYHSLWLGGMQRLPFVSGFTYCNKTLEMGVYPDAEHAYSKKKKIGFSDTAFYVLGLEMCSKKITWSINGKKVFESPNTLNIPLSICLSSGVVGKTNDEKLPTALEIDWIRVYNNPLIRRCK